VIASTIHAVIVNGWLGKVRITKPAQWLRFRQENAQTAVDVFQVLV